MRPRESSGLDPAGEHAPPQALAGATLAPCVGPGAPKGGAVYDVWLDEQEHLRHSHRRGGGTHVTHSGEARMR